MTAQPIEYNGDPHDEDPFAAADTAGAAPVMAADTERGGDIKPVAFDLEAYMARLRPEARDGWERARAETTPGPVETDAERAAAARAEVAATRARNRVAAWERMVRSTYLDFVDASLDDLDTDQDPDGRIAGWLDGPARTLLLVGQAGLGKSHAAIAVGNAAVHRDTPMWALVWTVPDLNDALRPGGDPKALDHARAADVVLLDDMGAEQITEWTIDQLYKLIDFRVRNRRKTMINTNLPYDDRGFPETPKDARPVKPNLVDRYGHRLIDRIMHDAVIVRFQGHSRRRPIPF